MRLPKITCTFLSSALLLILLFTSTGHADNSKSQFAFVFNSSRNPNPATFSLYGNHPLNQAVKLLHVSSNNICDAVTQKQEVFNDEVVSFPITVLKTISKCEAPTRYAVAFFGKISEYRVVSQQTVTDQEFTNSLDKAIRESSVLQTFKEATQTTRGIIPYDKEFPLNYFTPKIYRFSISNRDIYLVSYQKDEQHSFGPKFIVLDGRPQILTGWCSYPNVRAFILNQEQYFESGSGCCDCGITVMELFKIEADRVRLVHGDSSESD
ncbi:MAG TPA: hypothetical protein VN604_01825 [Nitrospirota bacterium]|nr:hypothetical protein [Nitrospirota bacterium]